MTCSGTERRAIADGLERLIAWAVAMQPDDVPARVLDKAALVLVDDLAAMAAASHEPELRALLAATNTSPAAEATIFLCGGRKAARQDAAFINGVAGCWCELDEGYRGAPCHAGLYVLPALLAEAEAGGASLLDVLARLAVSYEVTARIAECWRFAQASVHPHAVMAAMGGAVATGLSAGHPAPLVTRALAIAGGLVPAGSYHAAIEGALVRNLWTGEGAVTGMNAVRWAAAGFDGFADGPHIAFTALLGGAANPAALDAELGGRWAIEGCYHKRHGCCHSTHCAVEAALELRPALLEDCEDIARITLATHRPSMSNPHPANTLAARFSFEHVVATTLVHGHAGAMAFAPSTLGDPKVVRLRERVVLEPYPNPPPWPHDRAARLEVELVNGGTKSATCLSAPGGPDRPLDAAGLLAKAEAVAGAALPAFVAAATQIVEGAWRVEPWCAIANRLTAKG